MLKRVKRLLNSIMIALVLMISIGKPLFTHTHIYSTFSVTHSHPYWPAGNGNPGHVHSDKDFTSIFLLNAGAMLGSEALSLAENAVTNYKHSNESEREAIVPTIRERRLRAPPA